VKEAKERRKLEEEFMNSAKAADIYKRFEECVGGTYSEPKGRGGHIVWKPNSSKAGDHTEYQERDKSGGLGDGATSSETPQDTSRTNPTLTAGDSVVPGKLGEEHGHEAEGGENPGKGDEKRG